jgi:cytochrome P450
LINNPLQLLEDNRAHYGDIVGMRLITRDFIQLNRPDYIKHVLVDNQQNYIKGRALQTAQYIVGQGLLTSEGDLHRRQRQIMQPAFHRQQVSGYADAMVRLTLDHVRGWQAGQPLELHQEIMQLTMKIVAQTLFGVDVSANQQRLVAALDYLLTSFSFADVTPWGQLLARLPLPRNRRRAEQLAVLDEAIFDFIRDGSDTGSNLLGMLLEIRDEVMTMFIAGHETTANAIVWTFYLLAQHPQAEAKLRAEVETVLAGRPPTSDDLPSLKYVRMLFSEAMRLFPPAWAVGRLALSDDRIDDYPIAAGATILMSQWVMHRHPAYWQKPDSFDPTRFDPDSASFRKRPRYAYFPFGGGPRACIGERFAWTEGILLIATLAQRFRFALAPEAIIEPQPGITLRPKYGLPVIVHLRSPIAIDEASKAK